MRSSNMTTIFSPSKFVKLSTNYPTNGDFSPHCTLRFKGSVTVFPMLKWNVPTRDKWNLPTRRTTTTHNLNLLCKSTIEDDDTITDHTNDEEPKLEGIKVAVYKLEITDEDLYKLENPDDFDDVLFKLLSMESVDMLKLLKLDTYKGPLQMLIEVAIKGYGRAFCWMSGATLAEIEKSPEKYSEEFKTMLSSVKWLEPLSPVLVTVFDRIYGSKRTVPKQISFNDIIGADEAKARLRMVLSMSKGIGLCHHSGRRCDAMVIWGPDESQVEELANALAHEAKLPFYTASATVLKDVGEDKGCRVMTNMFMEAKRSSPSIIYLAHIEDIACTPPNKIFATLLAEITQSKKEGCALAIVASSTVDPKLLDASLIKSRHFVMNVEMEKLDEEARRRYVDLYLTRYLMEEQKDEIRSLIVSRTKDFMKEDFDHLATLSLQWADKTRSPHVTKEHVIAAFHHIYEASGLRMDEDES